MNKITVFSPLLKRGASLAKKAGGAAMTASIPVFSFSDGYGIGRNKDGQYNTNKDKAKAVAGSALATGAAGAAFGTSYLGKSMAKTGLNKDQEKRLKELNSKKDKVTPAEMKERYNLSKQSKEFGKIDERNFNRLNKLSKAGRLDDTQAAKLGHLTSKKQMWSAEKMAARGRALKHGTLWGAGIVGAGMALGKAVDMIKNKNQNQVTSSEIPEIHPIADIQAHKRTAANVAGSTVAGAIIGKVTRGRPIFGATAGAIAGAMGSYKHYKKEKKHNQVTAGMFETSSKEITFTIKPKPGQQITQYDIEDTIQKLGPDVKETLGVVRNQDGTVSVSLRLAKESKTGEIIKKVGAIIAGTIIAVGTTAAITRGSGFFKNIYRGFKPENKFRGGFNPWSKLGKDVIDAEIL